MLVSKDSSNGAKNLVKLGFLAIGITLTLSFVSLWLYRTSGAAQLDLSRPGYISDETQTGGDDLETDGKESFSAHGEISNDIVEEFEKLYGDVEKKVLGTEAFREEALGDEALGIE